MNRDGFSSFFFFFLSPFLFSALGGRDSCLRACFDAVLSKHGAKRPQKPQGLLGTGRRGEGGMEVGGEGDYIPIANARCIKVGSDESHFNVS